MSEQFINGNNFISKSYIPGWICRLDVVRVFKVDLTEKRKRHGRLPSIKYF